MERPVADALDGHLELIADVPLAPLPGGPPCEASEVLALVRRGFADVSALTGGQEDMTDGEFMTDWTDPQTCRFLCLRHGDPVGFAAVHVGLGRISWVPEASITHQQQALELPGAPLYVATLVVDPRERGGEVLLALLRRTVEELVRWNEGAGRRTAVYFDHTGRTARLLPPIIERVARTVSSAMIVRDLQAPGLEAGRSMFVLVDTSHSAGKP